MSDDLSIQGTLAETTVPELFRSVIRSNETGIVSLDSDSQHDDIYFRDGRIVFASSSDPDLSLAEVLLRSGELNLQQYTDATENSLGSKRMGAVLCELGYLRPEGLLRAVEQQVNQIVVRCVGYRTGNYTMEFTSEFPKEILDLTINAERLLMDGIQKIDTWSLISRGLGRMGRLVRQTSGADGRMYQFDVTDEESHVFSLLSNAQTIQSVCEQSYLPNFRTCRTVWALLTVNLIEDAEVQEIDANRAAEEGEFELVSDVERFNTAFEKLFKLVFQRIGDHTYDFLDRVVLHLSPDTLPYLSGMSLVNEGRVDFDQLLNNLIASGSIDKRALIINVLDELLYGWQFEIRAEFGAALEADVAQIVEPLRG